MSAYRIAYKNDVLLPGNYASHMRATRELSRLVERTKQWLKDFNEDDYKVVKMKGGSFSGSCWMNFREVWGKAGWKSVCGKKEKEIGFLCSSTGSTKKSWQQP